MQEDDNTGGDPYNLRSQPSGRSRTTYTSGVPAAAAADGSTGASARSRNSAGVPMTLVPHGAARTNTSSELALDATAQAVTAGSSGLLTHSGSAAQPAPPAPAPYIAPQQHLAQTSTATSAASGYTPSAYAAGVLEPPQFTPATGLTQYQA
ncbi:hypothetical protein ABBQ32_008690 [Trebouxia sp. C0010 RCD-2024]